MTDFGDCPTCASGCATCVEFDCDPCPVDAFGQCTNWQTGWAYRNETNTLRFLWDVFDATTDGGLDDTQVTIQDFTYLYYYMPCVAGSGYGFDGNCNEPHREMFQDCVPASPIGDAVLPMRATRDSGNAWDLSELVPGDQTAERVLNCTELWGVLESQAD